MICSDNGCEKGAGRSGPLKGYKTHLYEGGIRSSLIVWGPGFMPKEAIGTRNKKSVFSDIDDSNHLSIHERRNFLELINTSNFETLLELIRKINSKRTHKEIKKVFKATDVYKLLIDIRFEIKLTVNTVVK